jgi:hypothetical protein
VSLSSQEDYACKSRNGAINARYAAKGQGMPGGAMQSQNDWV